MKKIWKPLISYVFATMSGLCLVSGTVILVAGR